MKCFTLLFFASLCFTVNAYGQAGTYEQLLYWYTYQLDAESTQKSIAPGCSSWANTKGRCTFTQFMNYIADDNGTLNPKALAKITDASDVDTASKALFDGKYTGPYNLKRVLEGYQSSKVDGLFQKVSMITARFIGDAPAELQEKIRQSTLGLVRIRQQEKTEGFKKDFPKITFITSPKPVFPGSIDSVDAINPELSADANGRENWEKNCIPAMRENQQNSQLAQSHDANIQEAKNAHERISQACM